MEIDTSTIITGNFYTVLSRTKESTKQNSSKDAEDLNHFINHNITGIYRTPQPTTAEDVSVQIHI